MTGSQLRQTWLIFSQATTVALAAYFVVSTLKPQWLHQGPAVLATLPAAAGAPPRAAVQFSYAAAAQAASPAVVAVMANKPALTQREIDADPWLRFHFGRRVPQRQQMGLGSGVIVSPEGYVLTNNHVVNGASEIRVQLPDGRETEAKLVGTDPETDLAVLRITVAPPLPVIHPGRAEDLQVGDVVLAIGNPFNVGQTVTSGIVSALGRTQLGLSTFENFIQTDAAINPGNSGGALVDAQGRLVGINTAIYSRTGGGSLGIGFAIPVDSAYQVLEALIKDGKVSRGWIGVITGDINAEVVETLKLSVDHGVLVKEVFKGSPAAKAGLEAGDVVTEVEGRQVRNPRELINVVAGLKPESQTVVQVQRGGQTLKLPLQVGLRRPQTEDGAPE
ncbi:trypsin-like peptidase domain-containing protein [Roseateles amylovorans]|uniref:Trypsin-like peptidase domain-containing protein n=1 Tax=Roseateles amylovorans TaxID=2978473 RepID=A0ABY6B4R7_9BURK|nr:trypsin-like peptidase domain-containing protein [Roseateles amylovorans]UXH79736.1 trypsin-like peptidase domain-containing protein [Roseateles amylovorans]